MLFRSQLQGNFIELLSVTRPEDVPEPQQDEFSFGAYNRDFLATEEGMSMLALTSEGWERDRARLQAAGLPSYAPFAFGRKARQPDGREVTLDFRLTFTTDAGMPRAPFFTCDHRHPAEVFWKPQYQTHANGAQRIAEVHMVAETPEAHVAFLRRLFGAAVPIQGGVCAGLDGAGLCILEPDAFAETYPGTQAPALAADEARFGGFRVEVADLGAAEEIWSENRIPFVRTGRRLYVPSDDAFGVLVCLSAP